MLNNIVAMFSEYSSTKFSVEPVTVTYPKGASHSKLAGQSVSTPDLAVHELPCSVEYIRKARQREARRAVVAAGHPVHRPHGLVGARLAVVSDPMRLRVGGALF